MDINVNMTMELHTKEENGIATETNKIIFCPEPRNLSDVIVKDSESNEYHVHSQILGMYSTVFQSAFATGSGPHHVEMHHDRIVLTLFFQFMYSRDGTVFLRDYAFEVWKLCIEYDVRTKDLCIPQVQYLLWNCDAEMLISIINFSYQVCCTEVTKLALQQFFRRIPVTMTLLKQISSTILMEYLMKIQIYPGKEVMVQFDGRETKGIISFIDDYRASVKLTKDITMHTKATRNVEPIHEHMCVYVPEEQQFGYVQRLKPNGKCVIKIGNTRREYPTHQLTPHLPYLYHP